MYRKKIDNITWGSYGWGNTYYRCGKEESIFIGSLRCGEDIIVELKVENNGTKELVLNETLLTQLGIKLIVK